MRLKIKLKLANTRLISANYHYALSSAIYKLLKFGSPEFASFLHDTGYKLNGKPYKLFTFSLKFRISRVLNDVFHTNSHILDLFISSPIEEDFMKNFVIGTFEAKQFEINANNTRTDFSIEQAELLPEPDFKAKTKFIMYSPLVLSKYHMHNGKRAEYYFRFNDNLTELTENLNNNLINKYKLIHGKEYSGSKLKFEWDKEYIFKKIDQGKQIKKRIIITRDLNNPISVIGMEAPFYLEGNRDLMKVGYDCGFGKNNSMGFGMAEVVY